MNPRLGPSPGRAAFLPRALPARPSQLCLHNPGAAPGRHRGGWRLLQTGLPTAPLSQDAGAVLGQDALTWLGQSRVELSGVCALCFPPPKWGCRPSASSCHLELWCPSGPPGVTSASQLQAPQPPATPSGFPIDPVSNFLEGLGGLSLHLGGP